MAKKIKVIERKLGREKAMGISYGGGLVEIDSRLKGKERLDTIIHEVIHETYPFLDESSVLRGATIIAETLHKFGYRHTT